MPGYVIYSVSMVKIIKGGKDIISDGLSGVFDGEPLLRGKIGSCDTRGGLGRRFWVCSRNSVRLLEFGSGGVQVEGLQCAGHLVVRSWFLKWNYFFMVWMRWFADFRMRWCVEAGSVRTKLRPKVSTSVSVGVSWWEER